MAHDDEYTDAMVKAMDLIWGEGFMAPGGEGNVEQLVSGIPLHGWSVLDIGCGQGRASCLLASRYGARVIGTDLEAHLVQRATALADREGLSHSVQFQVVEPGPLNFDDESFDLIVVSGAMTQVEDKQAMYSECLRVLRPGGMLSCYDWMKPDGPLSDDMYRWFELEGLTYHLRTPAEHRSLLEAAGLTAAVTRDKSDWYRVESAREYERLAGELKAPLTKLLGDTVTAEFIESWRMLAELCERGELLQVYTRARKPDLAL